MFRIMSSVWVLQLHAGGNGKPQKINKSTVFGHAKSPPSLFRLLWPLCDRKCFFLHEICFVLTFQRIKATLKYMIITVFNNRRYFIYLFIYLFLNSLLKASNLMEKTSAKGIFQVAWNLGYLILVLLMVCFSKWRRCFEIS